MTYNHVLQDSQYKKKFGKFRADDKWGKGLIFRHTYYL